MFRLGRERGLIGGALYEAAEGYFQQRSGLSNLESEFTCDESCSRPGCKSPDMQIQGTVFDLMGASFYRGESVGKVYRDSFSLGLVPVEEQNHMAAVSLKLRKPCPFLELDRCGIYTVRPLPCIFFPECYALDNSLARRAQDPRFKEYRCLGAPVHVSGRRAEVIGRLGRIMHREQLVSDSYLFGRSPYWVDFSGFHSEWEREGAPTGQGCGEGYASLQVIEHAFLQLWKDQSPLFGEVESRVLDLEQASLRERLFHDLGDVERCRQLLRKKDDRAVVFRIVRGKLRTGRKSILPSGQVCAG